MKEDNFSKKLAQFWLICAGVFAIFLVLFLMRIDLFLTHTDGPNKADELLSEVRLAQTSLGSSSVDVRSHLKLKNRKISTHQNKTHDNEKHKAHTKNSSHLDEQHDISNESSHKTESH